MFLFNHILQEDLPPSSSSMPSTSSSSIPQVRFETLKFYIYHQLPQFVRGFWYTKTHQYPKWYKLSRTALIIVIFLAARVYLPQNWCCHCEGEMPISDHCELYLNFWSFLMCWCVFPFCWVWPNFAWTKFQWNCVDLFVGFVFLCDLFVSSSVFYYFMGVFLFLKWL